MNQLKKNHLLVTGGNGQLAWDLKQHSISHNIDLTALPHKQLDITSKSSIEAAIKEYKPSIIINTAAYTAVDQAEKEPEIAYQVNRDAASLLAANCQKHEIPLIHISTDYVFDGESNKPYLESDQPNPINTYGKSKYQGEIEIRNNLSQHIILRVSAVFGYHGHNFVKTILRLSTQQKELKIVADQTTCPTPAADIASVCLEISNIISQGKAHWGLYHYCGNEPTSWYHFAQTIIEEAKLSQNIIAEQITAITNTNSSNLAKRPKNSVLNCGKIYRTFGIKQRPWRLGLTQMIQALVK